MEESAIRDRLRKLLGAALLASLRESGQNLTNEQKHLCARALAGTGDFDRACLLAETITKLRLRVRTIRSASHAFYWSIRREGSGEYLAVELLLEHGRPDLARQVARSDGKLSWKKFLLIFQKTRDPKDLASARKRVPADRRREWPDYFSVIREIIRIGGDDKDVRFVRTFLDSNEYVPTDDHFQMAENFLELFAITRSPEDAKRIRHEMSLVNRIDHHVLNLWREFSSMSECASDVRQTKLLENKLRRKERSAGKLKQVEDVRNIFQLEAFVDRYFTGRIRGEGISLLAELLCKANQFGEMDPK